jgi:hypothetical protein
MDTDFLKKETIEILTLIEQADAVDRTHLIEELILIKQLLNSIEKTNYNCYMDMD